MQENNKSIDRGKSIDDNLVLTKEIESFENYFSLYLNRKSLLADNDFNQYKEARSNHYLFYIDISENNINIELRKTTQIDITYKFSDIGKFIKYFDQIFYENNTNKHNCLLVYSNIDYCCLNYMLRLYKLDYNDIDIISKIKELKQVLNNGVKDYFDKNSALRKKNKEIFNFATKYIQYIDMSKVGKSNNIPIEIIHKYWKLPSIMDTMYLYYFNHIEIKFKTNFEALNILKNENLLSGKLTNKEAKNIIFYTDISKIVTKVFNINTNKNIPFDFTQIKSKSENFNKYINLVDEVKNSPKQKNMIDLIAKQRGINKFVNINGIDFKFSSGGLTGAKNNYIGHNLTYYDATSYYPSIILNNKQFYSNFLDIPVLERLFEMKQKSTDKNKIKAVKSLLTGCFGMLYKDKSNVGLSIALKGQQIIIDFMINNHLKPIQCHTDGLISENKAINIISEKGINFVSEPINYLIMNNLNDYIKFSGSEYEAKGIFKDSFNNIFAKDKKKIHANLLNAINLMINKPVKIMPIYFRNKKVPYYYDSQKNLTIYEKNADLNIYMQMSRNTKNDIENFTYLKAEKKINKFDYIKDSEENIKLKYEAVNKIMELLKCDKKDLEFLTSLGGGKGSLASSYSFDKTLESSKCTGLKLKNPAKFIIIDIDEFKLEYGVFDEIDTFKSWNDLTAAQSRQKIILENDLNIVYKKKTNGLEILSSGAIWSLKNDFYRHYEFIDRPIAKASEYKNILDKFFNIEKDAKANLYYKKENTTYYKPSLLEFEKIREVLLDWGITKYRISGNSISLPCMYCQLNNYENPENTYINMSKGKNGLNLSLKLHADWCKDNKEDHLELFEIFKNDYQKALYGNCNEVIKFAFNYFNKGKFSISSTNGNELIVLYEEKTNIKVIVNDRDIDIIGDIDESIISDIKADYLDILNKDNFDLFFKEDFKSLKFENVENNGFFKNDYVMDIQTGAGKTYNSAKLVLYIANHTNRRMLLSTTKKENLDDLKREINKIIKLANDSQIKSKFISQWLDDTNKSYNLIGIATLIMGANLTEDQLRSNRVILTHHFYAFPKDNDFRFDYKVQKNILPLFQDNDILLIDEVDELEKIALNVIPLTNYYCETMTKYSEEAGGDEYILNRSNALLPCRTLLEYKNNADNLRFNLPEANTKGYFYTKDTIHNADGWELEPGGNVDIKEAFLNDRNILDTIYIPSCDDRPRKKIIALSDCDYVFARVDITSELIINRNKLNIEEATGGYLNNVHKAALCNQLLEVYKKKDELKEPQEDSNIFDSYDFIDRFETRESFIEWCKMNLKENNFDNLMAQLSTKEGKDLYVPYIHARRKSIFERFNCLKYLLTASPGDMEKLGYKIDSSLKNIKIQPIDRIDIFAIKKEKQIDNLIKKITLETIDFKKINSISFLALKEHIELMINDRAITADNKYNFLEIITNSKDSFGNDIRLATYCGRSEQKFTVEARSLITYLNGVDTTGKNYNDKNLCVINARGNLNVKARRIFGTNEIFVNSIEKACVRALIQGIGRITRSYKDNLVNTKYKAVIIYYEDIETVNRFMETKKDNCINFSLRLVEDKTTNKQLLKYINDSISKYNHNDYITPDETIFDYEDRRKTISKDNAKKYDYTEIKNLFEEAQKKYLEDNPGKSKLSLRKASELLGIPKNTIDRALKNQEEI
jgi:hypothetical protein